jgi:hypothetical protein
VSENEGVMGRGGGGLCTRKDETNACPRHMANSVTASSNSRFFLASALFSRCLLFLQPLNY